MSRFPRVTLVRRSRDFSTVRRKTPVSMPDGIASRLIKLKVLILDVVVLTAMGEQAAIEAKEAPKTG